MHGILEPWLSPLSSAPVSAEMLKLELKDYSQPVYKLHQLVKDGTLVRLKRGLYYVNPSLSHKTANSEVIANVLYAGVSCISLEYALSYYGLIPDRVMGVTSVVTGRSKLFTTPLGWFRYKTIPEKLMPIGVVSRKGALIASPERALCDYLLTRPNLRISSPDMLKSYLLEDVRFDFDSFEGYDHSIISAYAAVGYKRELFRSVERLFP